MPQWYNDLNPEKLFPSFTSPGNLIDGSLENAGRVRVDADDLISFEKD